MGVVLPFERPEPLQCQCGHCDKLMTRRSVSNKPAFCSYDCGLYGQPDNSGFCIKPTREGHN